MKSRMLHFYSAHLFPSITCLVSAFYPLFVFRLGHAAFDVTSRIYFTDGKIHLGQLRQLAHDSKAI